MPFISTSTSVSHQTAGGSIADTTIASITATASTAAATAAPNTTASALREVGPFKDMKPSEYALIHCVSGPFHRLPSEFRYASAELIGRHLLPNGTFLGNDTAPHNSTSLSNAASLRCRWNYKILGFEHARREDPKLAGRANDARLRDTPLELNGPAKGTSASNVPTADLETLDLLLAQRDAPPPGDDPLPLCSLPLSPNDPFFHYACKVFDPDQRDLFMSWANDQNFRWAQNAVQTAMLDVDPYVLCLPSCRPARDQLMNKLFPDGEVGDGLIQLQPPVAPTDDIFAFPWVPQGNAWLATKYSYECLGGTRAFVPKLWPYTDGRLDYGNRRKLDLRCWDVFHGDLLPFNSSTIEEVHGNVEESRAGVHEPESGR